MTKEILIAGFGGQGILFAGKFLAYGGLIEEKEVSWLPSYGPEMRGGTANCSIIVSDSKVGSPIVDFPDILVAMNAPSFSKYINSVKKGGQVFADSSLIDEKSERSDIECFYIPATRLASEAGLSGLANMIMAGLMLKKSGVLSLESVEKAMHKVVPPKKQNLFDLNMKAIKIGYDYED